MIREEIKQLKTADRDLRKFGLLVGAVFAALGILFWARGKPHFLFFLLPGAMLLSLGLVFPRALKHVYIAWMALAIVMGFVVSHILLTLFFFLVITPIGLTARLCGKDFLSLQWDRKATTYWIPRRRDAAKSAAQYEQQF